MRIRRIPADRKAELLNAAVHVARRDGYHSITREAVAEHAACSPGLVNKYFGTMLKLRRAVMSAAIARNDLVLIAQGLAAGDHKAQAAPPLLKRAAMEALL